MACHDVNSVDRCGSEDNYCLLESHSSKYQHLDLTGASVYVWPDSGRLMVDLSIPTSGHTHILSDCALGGWWGWLRSVQIHVSSANAP